MAVIFLTVDDVIFIQSEILSSALVTDIGKLESAIKRAEQYHYYESVNDIVELTAIYIIGIDLFIATQENRGQGLGVIIINQFINGFLSRFHLVVADPNHENTQAILCYKKADFEESNYSETSDYLLLVRAINLN